MKKLLPLLLLLWVTGAQAQKKATIDLKVDYGLTELQSKLQLSSLGTIAVTSAKFPRAYARMIGKGWSDAKFQTLSCFDAAWMDAVYQGQGGGQPITGVLNSQNHVIVPAGAYYQTVIAEFSGGEYIGQGSGYTDAGNASVNTQLVIWHELWNGDPLERHCLQSGTWAGSGNFSYVESTIIRGFGLEGRSNEFPTVKFNSSGIRMWKPGEVTYTTDIYARNFRSYGIEMYAPTPHHIGTLSAFDNVRAGIGCVGCWGGTVQVDEISCDDNGAIIESIAGNGSEGGGTWNIGTIKLETCVASSGRAWRGQVVGVFNGQFAVNVGAISAASGGCDNDAWFVTDTRLTNGTPQNSYIRVGAGKGFNFATLVHDITNGKRWAMPGDYVALGFEWTYRGGGTLTTVPAITSAPACSQRIDFLRTSGTPSHTTCTPYRYIIDGPPRSATTTYLDAAITPPPAGTWTCTAYGAWSACSNSTQTRTRTCTCTGGTCTDPKPAESETQACTVTPPPTGSAIDPNDVLVVWNSSDTRTQAWATSYASAWGIPAGNVVSVAAGTSHDATTTIATAIRTLTESKGEQYTVLAWEYPSRVGSQSITSLVTFGPRNVSSLTVSPLYNYTGTKPRTDKGVAPSALLVSNSYIRKDADGTRPTGQAISLLANDQTGTPRGSARANQRPTGVRIIDSRNNPNIGKGENFCNVISNDCYVSANKPGSTPIIAGYQSNYVLLSPGSAVFAKGFYGDNLTSYSGYFPGGAAPKYLNGQNQTALTYHLDKGASLSVGSVSEPWQDKSGNSPGSMVEQFVNVSIFHPLFIGGKPVGVAAWAAVQCPDRMLFCGDLLTAPFR